MTTAAVISARERSSHQDESVETRRSLLSGGKSKGFSKYMKRPSDYNTPVPLSETNHVSIASSGRACVYHQNSCAVGDMLVFAAVLSSLHDNADTRPIHRSLYPAIV